MTFPLTGRAADKEPDFAYPQTVIADARAALAAADKSDAPDAGAVRLRAMLEITAAENAIDRDSMFSFPAFVEEQLAKKGLTDADKAMMTAFEAQIFRDIYNYQRFKYDRVDAPAEPLPADINLWSGEQFRNKINALYAEAAALASHSDARLAHYRSCLDYSGTALTYIPDVAGFVALRKASWLDEAGTPVADKRKFDEETAARYPADMAPWFYWMTAACPGDKEMWKLYTDNEGVEAARYTLMNVAETGSTSEYEVEAPEFEVEQPQAGPTTNQLVEALRASLKRFPSWHDNAQLKNILDRITNPTVNASGPATIAPGEKYKIALKGTYATTATVKVYRLSTASGLRLSMVENSPCIGVRNVDFGGVPDSTIYVEIPVADAGTYAWTLSIGKRRADHFDTFKAIPIIPVVMNGLSEQATVVADYITGAPVKGVSVDLKMETWRDGRKKSSRNLGSTNGDGILRYKAESSDTWPTQYLTYKYKGRTYSFEDNMTTGRSTAGRNIPSTNFLLFTSRPVYHPGDSVEWAAVMATSEGVCTGKSILVEFRDANSQLQDSLTLATDASGRIYGKFATKKGTLTGNWRINLRCGDMRRSFPVMVSDFRLPTFSAEISSVERDVPAKGAVRISGKATTFSGMPVVGAKASITVMGAQRWRWFGAETELGRLEATTDAAGAFSIDVPASMLEQPVNDGEPYRDFLANLTVTSADGEAADASRGFTTGKPYVLSASTPEDNFDSSKPMPVKFMAYNADGGEVTIDLTWQLGTADKNGKLAKVLASGTVKSGVTADLDLSSVPAGQYALRVAPADAALAEPTNALSVVLFNEKRNDVPADMGRIYVPFGSVGVIDEKADVLVGINCDLAYVYTAVRRGDKLASLRVDKLERGFHRLKVDLDADDSQIQIFSVADGKTSQFSIAPVRKAAAKSEIKAESFRDRLVPGSQESWRFRLYDGAGKPQPGAAMIATLYNRALDEIQSGSWSNGFSFYTAGSYLNLRAYRTYGQPSIYASMPLKLAKVEETLWPEFRFGGIGQYMSLKIRGSRKMATTTGLGANVLMESAAVADMNASASYDTVIVKEESFAEAEAEEDSEELEDAGAVSAEPDKFDYRVAEVLQAFWHPALTADAEGNIDIRFTVPNANGSWRMKAYAWTAGLEQASYIAECVANKPVMVQPNLPRYLRQGDKARLLATVFNNSDATTSVTTTVEIFDIATGAVLSSVSSTDEVSAKGSTIVGIDVAAPVDAASIGYRVRSTAGGFADGEQTMIPVLASAATVIESTEFYLNPGDSKPFEFTVDASRDASLTLQYCQNPVWTAVKALRGIVGNESTSATGLASRIFSALAARKIIGDNAAIADALRQWSENPSEGALTSMLEKNENLKRLLLDQTPWVQAAADQSSRMAALAQVLEPSNTEAALRAATAALAKLQNPDGGFTWTSWSRESSVWSTENVLITLGVANSLGMLPSDGETLGMIKKAYAYLAAEALKRKNQPVVDTDIALIAALIPEVDTAKVKGIIGATEASIIKNWKSHGTIEKAWDILILKGKYANTAREILASVRQFGVVRQGQGLCFPNVSDIRGYATIIQAYAAMNAPKTEIDAMRQWVLVQAQASDDFGAYNPDYIVAALLLTGSNWTSVPVEQNVTVDGRPLAVDKLESATGYFSQTIDATGRKVKVSVTPNGVTPSYGSVVSISRKPMASVKARPGRDLSIAKRVLVQRNGEWVETNSFGLGERVRVQLTVVAKRNLEYVTIDDERPASFEPVEQLPGYVWDAGTSFYRENLDASTRLFISRLPKGTYHLTYDMTAGVAGTFLSGIATLQSQYAPELTAHSAGSTITVE